MRTSRRKPQLIGLVVMLCCFGSSTAQSKSAPLLKRLIGTWQGEGKAFGMEARMQIKWEEVLANKFVRLSLRNEMRTPTGQTQIFEGHAYYQSTSEGLYEAKWFDSRGISFPIKGQVEGEALSALWGTPEQEQGKSVYHLLGTGKLGVVDSVKQKDGSWREFGRFVLVREH